MVGERRPSRTSTPSGPSRVMVMVAVGRGGRRCNEASVTPSGTSLMIRARTPGLQGFAYSRKREGLVSGCGGKSMAAQSVEEELAELAELVREAERLGIDPWPPEKKERPWARWALGSFMIILMLSAVSKVLFRFVSIE